MNASRILASVDAEHFVGRDADMEKLARHFSGREGLTLLAAPAAGASELLRQTYDRLFLFQTDAVPFYFAVKKSDVDAQTCAIRFALELAAQTVAFRKSAPGLQFAIRDPEELAMLANQSDAAWIGRIAESLAGRGPDLRSLLSAPLRAAASGVRLLIIIDNLHEAQYLAGGDELVATVADILGHLDSPFVLCGHRRYLYGRTPFATRNINRLHGDALTAMVEMTAHRHAVNLADQPRDLIAVQLGGNVHQIESVIKRAAAAGIAIDRFADFEKLYAEEIFGGPIGKAIGEAQFAHTCELETDLATADYMAACASLDVGGESRAKVIGDAVIEYSERATRLMSRHYRSLASVDVRELLSTFDGRDVPLALMDYGRFKTEIKGRRDADAAPTENEEKFALPRIVFAAHGAHFYPQISEIADTESTAVGLGFEGEAKTVWIAAEIDSKLEADAELTEFCCDRIEMIGVAGGFESFRLWLIAPEGFDEEALAVLAERGAIGSSRRQIDMLRGHLRSTNGSVGSFESYDLVIPMGDDTEIVAAHTLETIAKRHGFSAKAINQMKTAVIEACINAAEHSLSPDRRTSLSFTFADPALSITVANRGLRLADRQATAKTADRRGWGLQLIENLMDEVTVDPTDDGTRLVMKKNRTDEPEKVSVV